MSRPTGRGGSGCQAAGGSPRWAVYVRKEGPAELLLLLRDIPLAGAPGLLVTGHADPHALQHDRAVRGAAAPGPAPPAPVTWMRAVGAIGTRRSSTASCSEAFHGTTNPKLARPPPPRLPPDAIGPDREASRSGPPSARDRGRKAHRAGGVKSTT